MHFNWKIRTLKEWRSFYAKAQSANWMQSWAYAQASFKTDYLVSKLATIEENDQVIGVMCVQHIKLGPFELVNLKRGPLWLVPVTNELLLKFAERFRKEFPKSFFQRMRWIPEFDFQEDLSKPEQQIIPHLEGIGFKLRKENFVTSWVDLNVSSQQLRSNLNQKWRNCLNKSEKMNLSIEIDKDLSRVSLFFDKYQQHKVQKKYHGPSPKFIFEELKELNMTDEFQILWAMDSGEPIAGVCIVFQGNTAAYRLGWNSAEGRKKNAHYSLIWESLLQAQKSGYKWFDLGGLLPEDAPGVTHFKEGLGGRITKAFTFS